MVTAERPTDLAPRVAQAAAIFEETVADFDLNVNYNTGKTECLSRWDRPAAREAKEAMEESGGILGVTLSIGGFLRFVKQYKHLGAIITDTGSMDVDIHGKTTARNNMLAGLSKVILRSRALGLDFNCNLSSA